MKTVCTNIRLLKLENCYDVEQLGGSGFGEQKMLLAGKVTIRSQDFLTFFLPIPPSGAGSPDEIAAGVGWRVWVQRSVLVSRTCCFRKRERRANMLPMNCAEPSRISISYGTINFGSPKLSCVPRDETCQRHCGLLCRSRLKFKKRHEKNPNAKASI